MKVLDWLSDNFFGLHQHNDIQNINTKSIRNKSSLNKETTNHVTDNLLKTVYKDDTEKAFFTNDLDYTKRVSDIHDNLHQLYLQMIKHKTNAYTNFKEGRITNFKDLDENLNRINKEETDLYEQKHKLLTCLNYEDYLNVSITDYFKRTFAEKPYPIPSEISNWKMERCRPYLENKFGNVIVIDKDIFLKDDDKGEEITRSYILMETDFSNGNGYRFTVKS